MTSTHTGGWVDHGVDAALLTLALERDPRPSDLRKRGGAR